MKFFAAFLLLAFVATVYAGVLPAVEQNELRPDAEAEPKSADPRDKRGLLYSTYSSPYAASYSYPTYSAAYSYPYAYASPVAYSSYAYPSYYRSSYYLG